MRYRRRGRHLLSSTVSTSLQILICCVAFLLPGAVCDTEAPIRPDDAWKACGGDSWHYIVASEIDVEPKWQNVVEMWAKADYTAAAAEAADTMNDHVWPRCLSAVAEVLNGRIPPQDSVMVVGESHDALWRWLYESRARRTCASLSPLDVEFSKVPLRCSVEEAVWRSVARCWDDDCPWSVEEAPSWSVHVRRAPLEDARRWISEVVGYSDTMLSWTRSLRSFSRHGGGESPKMLSLALSAVAVGEDVIVEETVKLEPKVGGVSDCASLAVRRTSGGGVISCNSGLRSALLEGRAVVGSASCEPWQAVAAWVRAARELDPVGPILSGMESDPRARWLWGVGGSVRSEPAVECVRLASEIGRRVLWDGKTELGEVGAAVVSAAVVEGFALDVRAAVEECDSWCDGGTKKGVDFEGERIQTVWKAVETAFLHIRGKQVQKLADQSASNAIWAQPPIRTTLRALWLLQLQAAIQQDVDATATWAALLSAVAASSSSLSREATDVVGSATCAAHHLRNAKELFIHSLVEPNSGQHSGSKVPPENTILFGSVLPPENITDQLSGEWPQRTVERATEYAKLLGLRRGDPLDTAVLVLGASDASAACALYGVNSSALSLCAPASYASNTQPVTWMGSACLPLLLPKDFRVSGSHQAHRSVSALPRDALTSPFDVRVPRVTVPSRGFAQWEKILPTLEEVADHLNAVPDWRVPLEAARNGYLGAGHALARLTPVVAALEAADALWKDLKRHPDERVALLEVSGLRVLEAAGGFAIRPEVILPTATNQSEWRILVLIRLGIAYELVGATDDAAEVWNRASQLVPDLDALPYWASDAMDQDCLQKLTNNPPITGNDQLSGGSEELPEIEQLSEEVQPQSSGEGENPEKQLQSSGEGETPEKQLQSSGEGETPEKQNLSEENQLQSSGKGETPEKQPQSSGDELPAKVSVDGAGDLEVGDELSTVKTCMASWMQRRRRELWQKGGVEGCDFLDRAWRLMQEGRSQSAISVLAGQSSIVGRVALAHALLATDSPAGAAKVLHANVRERSSEGTARFGVPGRGDLCDRRLRIAEYRTLAVAVARAAGAGPLLRPSRRLAQRAAMAFSTRVGQAQYLAAAGGLEDHSAAARLAWAAVEMDDTDSESLIVAADVILGNRGVLGDLSTVPVATDRDTDALKVAASFLDAAADTSFAKPLALGCGCVPCRSIAASIDSAAIRSASEHTLLDIITALDSDATQRCTDTPPSFSPLATAPLDIPYLAAVRAGWTWLAAREFDAATASFAKASEIAPNNDAPETRALAATTTAGAALATAHLRTRTAVATDLERAFRSFPDANLDVPWILRLRNQLALASHRAGHSAAAKHLLQRDNQP